MGRLERLGVLFGGGTALVGFGVVEIRRERVFAFGVHAHEIVSDCSPADLISRFSRLHFN